MSEILKKAKGVNGQLELLKNKIVIKRKGSLSFLTQGLKGNKEIQIKQISSIQLKSAGALTNGYIQFSFIGGQETKGGIFNATRDENSIMFKSKQEENFIEIKNMIEEKLDQYNKNTESSNSSSGLNDLEKLAELRDKGIITEEEFEAKKQEILNI